jgi:L-threonylcarbamoyladenylate synthase
VKTEVIGAAAPEAISRAVELLRRGEPVALPTETVYGLAADALNVDAALKIFEAKERPRFDPLIVHLPDREWLDRLTSARDPIVEKLIERFWPGPLTLVLPRRDFVPDIVTAGLATVAVRMSAHPVFAEVACTFGSPLAAPSANRFGRISPTEASHVLSELDGRIPLIIDGGSTTHGLESTIVAPQGDHIEVLRPGPITDEELREFGDVVRRAPTGDRPNAPGQLPSHYAPRTRLILTNDLCHHVAEGQRVGILNLRSLSARDDLREAAANLFRRLRELDDAGYDLIVAEEMLEEGLGAAIMDRLRRAAVRPNTAD